MMKIGRLPLYLLLGTWLALASSVGGEPIEASDPSRQALEELLEELSQKIDDANKRMVAHPTFLEELRTLVERYQAGLREIFLVEDFSDGDYTQNPSWVVDSGQFRISADRRLWSIVTVGAPAVAQESPEESGAVGVILKGILEELAEQEEEEEIPTPEVQEAAIHTLTQIGPYFEADITLISNSEWGRWRLCCLGESRQQPIIE